MKEPQTFQLIYFIDIPSYFYFFLHKLNLIFEINECLLHPFDKVKKMKIYDTK